MKYENLTKYDLDEIKQKASDAMQQLERNEIDDPIIQHWHFSDWLLSIFNMLQTIENLAKEPEEEAPAMIPFYSEEYYKNKGEW